MTAAKQRRADARDLIARASLAFEASIRDARPKRWCIGLCGAITRAGSAPFGIEPIVRDALRRHRPRTAGGGYWWRRTEFAQRRRVLAALAAEFAEPKRPSRRRR